MRMLVAALQKELQLHWRGRAQLVSFLVFGAVTLLLFSFAIGPDSEALRRHAPGFIWLALMLSSTLTLSESFHAELELGALRGQLLLPVDARAIYYSKALANAAVLTLLGTALLPLAVVLYDVPVAPLPRLVGVVALGALGLAGPGTLYAAMAAQTRAGQTLMPLLLFPLVVPVLLAAVKATDLILFGDPMGQLGSWQVLLLSFDALYWSICGILFGRIVED